MVRDVQHGIINHTSISIMWQPLLCLQQNGVIVQYKVRYRESSVTSEPFLISTTSFTADSLFPGTSYTFEVAAVNSKGTGPYEQHVVQLDNLLVRKNIFVIIMG